MHITYIYSAIIQNLGYAPGLALGRWGVSLVSQWWLWDLLLHEDLLLILFNHPSYSCLSAVTNSTNSFSTCMQ